MEEKIKLSKIDLEYLERIVFYNRVIKMKIKQDSSIILYLDKILDIIKKDEPWIREKYELYLTPIYKDVFSKKDVDLLKLISSIDDVTKLLDYDSEGYFFGNTNKKLLNIFLS